MHAGDGLERAVGDEHDALHGAAAADADLRHDLPLRVRGVGGDRHEADVAQAVLELARTLGGQGGADLEQRLTVGVEEARRAGQVLPGQRVDERPGVEERDGADA